MTLNNGNTALTCLLMKKRKKKKREIEGGGIVLVDDKSHLKNCRYWLNLWIEKDLKSRTPSMTRVQIMLQVRFAFEMSIVARFGLRMNQSSEFQVMPTKCLGKILLIRFIETHSIYLMKCIKESFIYFPLKLSSEHE
ncbi:hypothetical protein Scep_024271 [Stephania cephalantha]|uniref:Uncharacterized protein n=1 Tax=Stephania cephalantha TaxID=152367 RepID=A0AAP0EXE4_9MAGN